MKVKSIGANKTQVELNNLIILISYETPVAAIRIRQARVFGTPQYDGALKTNKYWSNTTSKHINTWLKDHGHDPKHSKVGTMDQSWFNELLEDNTG